MDCIAPKLIWPHMDIDKESDENQAVSVACGKCIPCLQSKRNDWSFRLEQEHRYSTGALFITLTYDDKHCPSDYSLRKKDLQLFMKRLRKKEASNRLRYYAVGEYGSKFGRPHYHVLLFNCNDQSLIRGAWCDSHHAPIGQVHIGKVTSASVAYVTKYIVQPQEADGREKPFSLMSRKYGIGGKYLTDNIIAWHRDGFKNYCIRDGQKVRMPRFYKTKVFYDRPRVHVKVVRRTRVAVVTMDDSERVALRKKCSLEAIKAKETEISIWKKEHGERWAAAMLESRDRVLQTVKFKVQYSQKF